MDANVLRWWTEKNAISNRGGQIEMSQLVQQQSSRSVPYRSRRWIEGCRYVCMYPNLLTCLRYDCLFYQAQRR